MSYTADTLDVLSEQEARDAVGGNSAPKPTDDLLSRMNTAIARRLDRLCGAVVQRTVTAEIQKGCACAVWLKQAPAASITSVTEYNASTSRVLTAQTLGSAAPASGYFAELNSNNPSLLSGRLLRRTNGYDDVFWPWVSVTYVAGRFASTSAVDDIFKTAASLMLKNLWRAATPTVGRQDEFDVPYANFPTFTVPKAVLEMLSDEILETPGLA